jgi:FkbM family methyltransferase
MFPEELSMKLIGVVSDEIDINREGHAIEIGVGTINFYSPIYKKLNFKTIAIDPIPHEPFLILANEQEIVFDETCIYKEDGEIELFTSHLSDLSSVHSNWWGVENEHKKSKRVRSKTLNSFFSEHQIKKITFLKVDTEGSELEILSQLVKGNENLPLAIEFEYGGGGKKTNWKRWMDCSVL